ncbi:MAG TPA: hypothetical protein VGI76_08590 [Solirubrobacteraceae bacterium]
MARRRETDSIPWPLVRGALDRGDLEWLRRNAARLAPIRLTDALRICLIVRDREPAQYERAAVRWLGRFALEARNATLADLKRAAEALSALPNDANTAMEELATLCRHHKLPGC